MLQKIHTIAFLEIDFQNLLIALNEENGCVQFFRRLPIDDKSLQRGNAEGF